MAAVICPELEAGDLEALYTWIDEIPLSRQKVNISRDFADGVLAAEVVSHFFPKLVELHNYCKSFSTEQKTVNWKTLNAKVFKKIGFQMHPTDMDSVVKAQSGAIERVLFVLWNKIEKCQHAQARKASVGAVPHVAAPGNRRLIDGQQHEPRADAGAVAPDAADEDALPSEEQAELMERVQELMSENAILKEKCTKLHQLVQVKDSKIEALTAKLQKHGLL
mmetsp:Transcript_26041/g.72800  ORF Transcript_26041/g.72800 Transcript_26041/m.72800 type:complete len:221 (-) Transcript_26041:130-792(-)|eukprot:CAMPEP_0117550158 /NCGR_PEP_ID=MMETSP0784-20121206/48537_1 /TAXON_ID=39447 /ORGANISM="" /LENGTH=220 /DNA_ID=CAMNT_0005347169 /DNA_START=31 /DNA_END=696 /DNA_ORIENTATION=+